jgi:hypothetical protein
VGSSNDSTSGPTDKLARAEACFAADVPSGFVTPVFVIAVSRMAGNRGTGITLNGLVAVHLS